ncbi:sulfurtransferase complex subunit TusB [Shewanella schlegeliana]|uniref:Sulfurtransferase complex subunit TusB n=1 Tax=Shewanella schlegeliana TaxID=190308 RepID=A0ABS1T016_9GAMM|nr:sulfurtransferase complex subunit TusB [Shewanella schlegeliana]MBL4913945.1 sulfurtransferase complex subunit TusB [Shewanella schlegeliana]MCL1108671.1 sulfurtransferase complex subunit TusB [Shewanella schlegeliana]GIU26558.1 sulfurtransferase TusB [Shewanella schlegeliana]
MILHHIQDSVEQSSGLTTCLRYIALGDSILLSGNAINCLLKREWRAKLANLRVVALKEDVNARGLQDYLKDVKQISYNEFVELSLEHEKVISW